MTFFFTDIEGSTRLLTLLGGDRYADVLAGCRRVLRASVEEHGGIEVDAQGDALFAAFRSANDAVAAAVAAQRAVFGQAWPGGASVRVRMGLHTGEAVAGATGYVGLDVHRAARVCAAGHGGQIVLSQTTRDILEGHPVEGVTLRDLGEHWLRDLGKVQHLYQVLAPDLPVDSPPLQSLDPRSNNLPIPLTSFVGREREIDEIKTRLRDTRLLTLIGTGGCGKTRLALRVASDVVNEFGDGVWFVDLVGVSDPIIVPQAVASVVGVREASGSPLSTLLTDYLRDKRLLLVLDNCEHLIAGCARLSDALLRACPHVKILATSREAIDVDGEWTFRVPSLSIPDLRHLPPPDQLMQHEAIRLFAERARWSLSSFAVSADNAGAVARICVQLDGIPLAIEMAAARVKVLTVEQIAARLNDRFRLLSAGSRTAVPRHQTLQAALDWSFNLLPESERDVLRRVSVFSGGWALEAAESLCAAGGIEPSGVLDLLSRLVDKSLVICEPRGGAARFRLLETVRQYGLDRLTETGEADEIRRRHRDWYLALAEQTEPGLRDAEQDVLVSRLEAEHDNFRAALTWTLVETRRGQDAAIVAEAALRLAGALWWFWFIGGYYSEGRRWLEQALAAGGGAPPTLRARALLGQGVLRFMLGDFRGAVTHLEESAGLAEAAANRPGIAWATGWLGVPAIYAGDNTKAVALFEASLALWRRLDDLWGIAWMAQALGAALAAQGEIQRAAALLQEALSLCRKVGDKWVTALTLHNCAYWAIARGEFTGVGPLVDESLLLFRKLGDKRGMARALGSRGLVARARGRPDEAAASFRESLALSREIGDRRGVAVCIERLGSVACLQKRLRKAARLFGAADALREAIGVEPAASGRAVYEFGGTSDRDAAREAMGDSAFEKARAEGRAMTLEHVVEYASTDTNC